MVEDTSMLVEWFDVEKWTVHFLDDLRYVVIHSHSYWYPYKLAGFKNPESESDIPHLRISMGHDSRVWEKTLQVQDITREKTSVGKICRYSRARDITCELAKKQLKRNLVWEKEGDKGDDWFGQYV